MVDGVEVLKVVDASGYEEKEVRKIIQKEADKLEVEWCWCFFHESSKIFVIVFQKSYILLHFILSMILW